MTDEEIEIALLLKAIHLKYGYDFSDYAKASLTRRIKKNLQETGAGRIVEMIPKIIDDPEYFRYFLANMSVNVTQMFRDPLFYGAVREKVVPYLKTYPFIKVWSAGTSTGQEGYSLAIMLEEEGVYDHSTIYATDFDDDVLAVARKGIYSAAMMKESTRNYQKGGGRQSFARYFRADYDSVIFKSSLKQNIVFANHNLVTDGVFGEMNLIFCRNVLIYFNKELQDRVLQLFYDSLRNNGFLCLGEKETIDFSPLANAFTPIDRKRKIYQKKQRVPAKAVQ